MLRAHTQLGRGKKNVINNLDCITNLSIFSSLMIQPSLIPRKRFRSSMALMGVLWWTTSFLFASVGDDIFHIFNLNKRNPFKSFFLYIEVVCANKWSSATIHISLSNVNFTWSWSETLPVSDPYNKEQGGFRYTWNNKVTPDNPAAVTRGWGFRCSFVILPF